MERIYAKPTFAYIFLLVLTGLTFWVFTPALDNGFVNYDDTEFVVYNNMIRQINAQTLDQMFGKITINNYKPLTYLSYAVEYYFVGLDPFLYHLDNLIFHLLNILLVFFLVRRISEKPLVPIIAALLFAIHPLRVESVAWVAERKDVLYVFFYLSALIVYLQAQSRRKLWNLSAAGLLFVLAAMSKPQAVSLPAVLLLLDYLKGRNFSDKNLWLEKAPYFAISLVFLFVNAQGEQLNILQSGIDKFSFIDRLFFACFNILAYLGKTIAPVNLSCFYPLPEKINGWLPWYFYLAPLGIAALVYGAYRSRAKVIIFGGLFFGVTIALVLQIIPLSDTLYADRYTYLPSVGLFYLLGTGISAMPQARSAWVKRLFYPALGVLGIGTVVFCWASYERCKVWENSEILWTDAILKNPRAAIPYTQRGIYLAEQRQFAAAMSDFNKTLSLRPDYYQAYVNRGVTLNMMGRFQEAIVDFDRSLTYHPGNPKAYGNRGNSRRELGQYNEAIQDFSRAASLDPYDPSPHVNMGSIYKQFNSYDKALEHFNKAIAINPDVPEAYNNRGSVYYHTAKYQAAVADYTRAIRLRPTYARAYYNRAIGYLPLQEFKLALRDAQQAQALGYPVPPDFIERVKISIANDY